MHVVLVAQHDVAVGNGVHDLAVAIEAQRVALGAFEAGQGQHHHVRLHALEVGNKVGLDGGGRDLFEMVSQQPCNLRRFGRYIGHDQDLQGFVFHTVSLARKDSA